MPVGFGWRQWCPKVACCFPVHEEQAFQMCVSHVCLSWLKARCVSVPAVSLQTLQMCVSHKCLSWMKASCQKLACSSPVHEEQALQMCVSHTCLSMKAMCQGVQDVFLFDEEQELCVCSSHKCIMVKGKMWKYTRCFLGMWSRNCGCVNRINASWLEAKCGSVSGVSSNFLVHEEQDLWVCLWMPQGRSKIWKCICCFLCMRSRNCECVYCINVSWWKARCIDVPVAFLRMRSRNCVCVCVYIYIYSMYIYIYIYI
jgi:hypothetical protein